MHQDSTLPQKSLERGLAPPKVLYPNRAIGEDHLTAFSRLRGIGRKPGAKPRSAASLRALSWEMSACRPAWIRAVFWRIPVSRLASWRSFSSRFSVVLICTMMQEKYR